MKKIDLKSIDFKKVDKNALILSALILVILVNLSLFIAAWHKLNYTFSKEVDEINNKVDNGEIQEINLNDFKEINDSFTKKKEIYQKADSTSLKDIFL